MTDDTKTLPSQSGEATATSKPSEEPSAYYLEIGHEDSTGNRLPMRTIHGPDAYDLWHLSVRYKELIRIRTLMSGLAPFRLEDMPRPNKFLLTYLALQQSNALSSVLELGSSMMEIVDGLRLVEKVVKDELGAEALNVRCSDLAFSGVEISDLMREASLDAHERHPNKVEVYSEIDAFRNSSLFHADPAKNFVHDWGVASYALSRTEDFCEFLSGFSAGMLHICYATDGEVHSHIGDKSHLFFDARMLTDRFPGKLFSAYDAKIVTENWFNKGPEKDKHKTCHARLFLYGERDALEERLKVLSHCREVGHWYREQVSLTPLEELI